MSTTSPAAPPGLRLRAVAAASTPEPPMASDPQPQEVTVVAHDGVTRVTLRVGQAFATRAEVCGLAHDFALAQGKRAVEHKRRTGGNRFVYVCNSAAPCAFEVRGFRSQRQGAPRYVVTGFCSEHSAGCVGKPAITQRQVLQQLKALAAAGGGALPLSKSDVQRVMKRAFGADVPTRMAYRAKDALAGSAELSASREIQKLESLLAQFQQLNAATGVRVSVESDESETAAAAALAAAGSGGGGSSTFRRAFVQFPYAAHIQQHACARVLGLHVVQMGAASVMRGSHLLELVAKDGNHDSYVLALALCDASSDAAMPVAAPPIVDASDAAPAAGSAQPPAVSTETFAWFLRQCCASGLSLDMPLLCDRTPELVQAAAAALPLGSSLLVQCTQHLLDRMARALKTPLPSDVVASVWRAQAAATRGEFDEVLGALSLDKTGKPAAEFLAGLDPQTWARHCFVHRLPLYNWQTTTLGESENPATLAARDRGPIEFFQSYMVRCIRTLYARKGDAARWLAAGQELTAFAQDALDDQRLGAAHCCVAPSDGERGTAYVWDSRDAFPKKRRVNLSAKSCLCAYPDQMGLPCKHLVAALQFFNSRGSTWALAGLCHPLYSLRAYFEAYGHASGVEMPVNEELVLNPRLKVKQQGSGTRRCSVCQGFGHNKRKCPSQRQQQQEEKDVVEAE